MTMIDGGEEPAWVTAKADQRIALMRSVMGGATAGFASYGVILTPLTEPPEGSPQHVIEQWEHTCDNCGRFCPNTLVTGAVTREVDGSKVTLTFGACPRCMEA